MKSFEVQVKKVHRLGDCVDRHLVLDDCVERAVHRVMSVYASEGYNRKTFSRIEVSCGAFCVVWED